MSGWRRARWMNSLYLSCIPVYPIGYLLVNGWREDQFLTRLYVRRSLIEPSDKLRELVDQEFDRLEDVAHPKIVVSLTDKLAPTVYGGFFLRFGAEIQFPYSMSFTDIEYAHRLGAHVELDLGEARHRRKLEVTSDLGVELLTRMLLSEEAQKFCVQRELRRANSGFIFSMPMLGWATICAAGYPLMKFFSTIIGPITASAASLSCTILLFRLFSSSFEHFATMKLDEETAMLGDDYLRGARSYLKSQLSINRLIRKIMGEEGERLINKKGDFQMSVAYTERLKAVEKMATSIKGAQIQSPPISD